MMLKSFVRDYLTFSKKDRIAIFFLLFLLLGLYLLPRFFARPPAPHALEADTALLHVLDTLQEAADGTLAGAGRADANGPLYEPYRPPGFTPGALFPFDPNTLPAAGWKRLGLRDRTIRTILNYRGKGGRFYRPEDVQKIWGLPPGFYEHVAAYIRIPQRAQKNGYAAYPAGPRPEKSARTPAVVNVNTADTADLIRLPGIGSRLAARIIAFRDKLGGFHAVQQLAETYGLPDSTFQKLQPYFGVDGRAVKKHNINTATAEGLRTHPYIRWNLANAIVAYRSQHGPYRQLEELKNIVLVDEATFRKIAPYLTVE